MSVQQEKKSYQQRNQAYQPNSNTTSRVGLRSCLRGEIEDTECKFCNNLKWDWNWFAVVRLSIAISTHALTGVPLDTNRAVFRNLADKPNSSRQEEMQTCAMHGQLTFLGRKFLVDEHDNREQLNAVLSESI